MISNRSVEISLRPQSAAKYIVLFLGLLATCGALVFASGPAGMGLDLCVYAGLMLLLLRAITKKYRSVINPFSYFALFYGLQTIFAPLAFYFANIFDPWDIPVLERTILYSACYLLAVGSAFLIPLRVFEGPLAWSLNHLAPTFKTPSFLAIWAVRIQIVASFAMLVYTSQTTAWFTNPRVAYSQNRQAGAGLWWALTEALLLLHFVLVLSRRRFPQTRILFGRVPLLTLRISPLLITCLLCALPAYFLGSKAMMLSYFVIGIFYYHWTVRPLSSRTIVGLAILTISSIFGLQLLQGTAQSLFDAVMYFDYFRNTARFLGEFDRYFGHSWGANTLSELWFYVPRALYSAKPKAFGLAGIMEVFYPGAADAGATPGILPWASAYLDFALPGIIVFGLFKGFVSKAAFRAFRERHDIPSLMVLAQIGLITTEIMQFFFTAPFLVFWLWMAFEVVLIRLFNEIQSSIVKWQLKSEG